MPPCTPWVTPTDLPAEGRPNLPAGTTWEELCAFASDVLFDLSGGRWQGDCGEVTAVLEPGEGSCPSCCGTGRGYPVWTPVLLEGQFYNITCCTPTALQLPDSAARQVLTVSERGHLRDPASYRLAAGGWLHDRSGRGWWPCGGGGIAVTYLAGQDPPAGGVLAARTLALELGKAAAGDGGCRLPARVTSLVRQGVTIGVLDRWPDLDKGRTGLYTVDLWLSSVTRTVRGGAVWSPDLPAAHRA